MYKSVKITPKGVEIQTLRSDTSDVMRTETVRPRYLNVELPTGQVISFETILEHLEQEFGPWTK